MGESAFEFVQPTYIGTCGKCGIPIWLECHRAAACRKEGPAEIFYCPNGHARCFTEGKVQELEKQLEKERQRREWAEQNLKTARAAEAIAWGKFKAQSKRIKNGVCPCCRRNFTNLRRHMKSKHPDWKGNE